MSDVTPIERLDLEPYRRRIATLTQDGMAHLRESHHGDMPDPECVNCDDIYGELCALKDLVAEVERLRQSASSHEPTIFTLCSSCRGLGRVNRGDIENSADWETCFVCQGTGTVIISRATAQGDTPTVPTSAKTEHDSVRFLRDECERGCRFNCDADSDPE